MRKINVLSAFLVLFTALSFTACDTEPVDPVLLENGQNPNNPNNPNNPDAPAVFKVDYSGTTHTAVSTLATLGNGLIVIQGIMGSNGEAVSIVIDGTTAGTYNEAIMNYSPSNASEYGYTNFNLSTGETSGTVTIVSIDTVNHTFTGNFSFTGWYDDEEAGLPTMQFTNGVFQNVPYVGNDNPLPGSDSFVATVDDEEFNYVNDLVVALGGEFISINANADTHDLQLFIQADITTGTHVITNEIDAIAKATYYDATTDTDYDITEGTLNITSNDGTTLVGTFSFPVKNELGETIHIVTAGAFSVEYNF